MMISAQSAVAPDPDDVEMHAVLVAFMPRNRLTRSHQFFPFSRALSRERSLPPDLIRGARRAPSSPNREGKLGDMRRSSHRDVYSHPELKNLTLGYLHPQCTCRGCGTSCAQSKSR